MKKSQEAKREFNTLEEFTRHFFPARDANERTKRVEDARELGARLAREFATQILSAKAASHSHHGRHLVSRH